MRPCTTSDDVLGLVAPAKPQLPRVFCEARNTARVLTRAGRERPPNTCRAMPFESASPQSPPVWSDNSRTTADGATGSPAKSRPRMASAWAKMPNSVLS